MWFEFDSKVHPPHIIERDGQLRKSNMQIKING